MTISVSQSLRMAGATCQFNSLSGQRDDSKDPGKAKNNVLNKVFLPLIVKTNRA